MLQWVTAYADPSVSASQLKEILSGIDTMPVDGTTNYAAKNWSGLLRAAAQLQASDQTSVELAVWRYQDQLMSPQTAAEESKLLLLFRVMFELPENARSWDRE